MNRETELARRAHCRAWRDGRSCPVPSRPPAPRHPRKANTPMSTTTTPTDEQQAEREDATRKLAELRAVARELWSDRDDPLVQSELSVVLAQIRSAEAVLRGERTDTTRAAA